MCQIFFRFALTYCLKISVADKLLRYCCYLAEFQSHIINIIKLLWNSQIFSFLNAKFILPMKPIIMMDFFIFISTPTNLGKVSEPCCIKAPSENQNVLKREKLLWGLPPLISTSVHSYGLHRPTRKRTKLTATKAIMTQNQTWLESGYIKEKIPGFSLSGFFIIILIPVCMNGFVKSTTLCLSSVIVSGAMAISALWKVEGKTNKKYLKQGLNNGFIIGI